MYLGIDADNGSKFINDLHYRYCLDEKITFTRSRPYKKNDQAHVEHTCQAGGASEKTGPLCGIRLVMIAGTLLESIYEDLRLYINFFQPSSKLIAKERIGGYPQSNDFIVMHYVYQFIDIFSCNSLLLGSTRTDPSGKMMVGTLRYPLFTFIINSVASSFPSRPTRRYLILLVSKNAFARWQSEQYSVVYITICDGAMV